MGQYWNIINPVKYEYLNPHMFLDGVKFMEFSPSPDGVMAGLALLLADPEGMGRGGGDIQTKSPMLGHWFGDPAMIVGDYGDPIPNVGPGPQGEPNRDRNLDAVAQDDFDDISLAVLAALLEDDNFAEAFREKAQDSGIVKAYPDLKEFLVNANILEPSDEGDE